MARVNQFQKKHIIEFMDKNEKILFGRFSSVSGKNKKEKLWIELVTQLNNLGPPNKNATTWKNVNIFLSNRKGLYALLICIFFV